MPYNQWLKPCYSRLNEIDATAIVIQKPCVGDMAVNLSTVAHPASGVGCFRTTFFATREAIGYENEPLAYADLGFHFLDSSTYGLNVMSVSKLDILSSAVSERELWKRITERKTCVN